jgi:hypothetical protein
MPTDGNIDFLVEFGLGLDKFVLFKLDVFSGHEG